ncbi:MAG: hypothetical protein AAFQ51_19210, partial [Pseudomonadota bacterium]
LSLGGFAGALALDQFDWMSTPPPPPPPPVDWSGGAFDALSSVPISFGVPSLNDSFKEFGPGGTGILFEFDF